MPILTEEDFDFSSPSANVLTESDFDFSTPTKQATLTEEDFDFTELASDATLAPSGGGEQSFFEQNMQRFFPMNLASWEAGTGMLSRAAAGATRTFAGHEAGDSIWKKTPQLVPHSKPQSKWSAPWIRDRIGNGIGVLSTLYFLKKVPGLGGKALVATTPGLSEGEDHFRNMVRSGVKKEHAYKGAVLVGTVVGALEAYGLGKLTKGSSIQSSLRQWAKQRIKAGVIGEGGTEVLQDGFRIAAESYQTGNNPDAKEVTERLFESGLFGSLTGTMGGAAFSPANVAIDPAEIEVTSTQAIARDLVQNKPEVAVELVESDHPSKKQFEDADIDPGNRKHRADVTKAIKDELAKPPVDEDVPENFPTPEEIETQRYEDRANAADTQAGRNEILAADTVHGRPDRIINQEVQESAAKVVNADPAAKTAQYKAVPIQSDLTLQQLAEVRELIKQIPVSSALGNQQAFDDLTHLNSLYRGTKTRAAQVLQFGRDPVVGPDGNVISDPIEDSPGDRKAKLGDLISQLDNPKKIRERLRKSGWTDADFDKATDTQQGTMQLVDQIKAANWKADLPTFTNWAYEAWHQSLLSGPHTVAANIIGNTSQLGLMGFDRVIEGVINSARKSAGLQTKSNVDMGDIPHYTTAMFGSLQEALRNAFRTWHFERSAIADDFGKSRDAEKQLDKMDIMGNQRFAIPGQSGRMIRMFGWRHLQMADDFFKTLVAYSSAGAEAHRIAKSEGLSEQPYADRVAKLLGESKRTGAAWSRAWDAAQEATFQQEGGQVTQRVKKAGLGLRKVPSGRWWIPFIKTPTNIFAAGLERTPLGFYSAFKYKQQYHENIDKEVRRLRENGVKPNEARKLAEQKHRYQPEKVIRPVLGTMAMLGLWFVSGDDEDKPLAITGSSPRSSSRRSLNYRVSEPFSIKMGDTYMSYKRIEPVATMLATMIDGIEAMKGGKPSTAISSIFRQTKDKTFLTTVGDIMRWFDGEIDGRDILANTFAGFVPNAYRQPTRNLRNVLTDTRIRPTDSMQEAGLKLRGKMFVLGGTKRQDIWGRTIHPQGQVDGYFMPLVHAGYRTVSPLKITGKNRVSADVALARWNSIHAGDKNLTWAPDLPNATFSVGGEQQRWNPEEYEVFVREAGQLALQMSERIEFTDPPTERQINALKKIFSRARAAAKVRVWQEFRSKAPDQNGQR